MLESGSQTCICTGMEKLALFLKSLEKKETRNKIVICGACFIVRSSELMFRRR